MPAPSVSVLVVTFNGEEHLPRFLASVQTTIDVTFEVAVVDNASRGEARDLLVEACRDGHVQCLTLLNRNTLFAPGVNVAARTSHPDSSFVLLLNPDTEIRDPRWLSSMLKVHRRGATSLGFVEGGPWPRADGYCLLVDRDLFVGLGGLSDDHHWWWAVTKLQADLLRLGHSVIAVRHHDELLTHVGGGSGEAPWTAKGMDVTAEQVRGWFEGRHIHVLDSLD